MSSTKQKQERTTMTYNEEVSKQNAIADELRFLDCLCERGGRGNEHVGNLLLHKFKELYADAYSTATTNQEKKFIASTLVIMFLDSGGRFMKWVYDKAEKKFNLVEVSFVEARGMCCQKLRDYVNKKDEKLLAKKKAVKAKKNAVKASKKDKFLKKNGGGSNPTNEKNKNNNTPNARPSPEPQPPIINETTTTMMTANASASAAAAASLQVAGVWTTTPPHTMTTTPSITMSTTRQQTIINAKDDDVDNFNRAVDSYGCVSFPLPQEEDPQDEEEELHQEANNQDDDMLSTKLPPLPMPSPPRFHEESLHHDSMRNESNASVVDSVMMYGTSIVNDSTMPNNHGTKNAIVNSMMDYTSIIHDDTMSIDDTNEINNDTFTTTTSSSYVHDGGDDDDDDDDGQQHPNHHHDLLPEVSDDTFDLLTEVLAQDDTMDFDIMGQDLLSGDPEVKVVGQNDMTNFDDVNEVFDRLIRN